MKKHFLIMSLLFVASLNCQALAAIPVLNSRSGAPYNILLDFHGDSIGTVTLRTTAGAFETWHNASAIPPFDTANYPDFLPSESFRNSLVNQIWEIVSDRYSMFNVNVTTDSSGYHNSSNTQISPANTIRVVFDDNGYHWKVGSLQGPPIFAGHTNRGASLYCAASHPNSALTDDTFGFLNTLRTTRLLPTILFFVLSTENGGIRQTLME